MTVGLVVVSHSGKIADGAVELAAQMAPDVLIIPAGGTDDGRIGTSLERVMAALEQAAGGDGVVVLTDLGSAVMTAESAVEFAADPASVLLADAPLVEGLVAAAVAAQVGGDAAAVKEAAEAVCRPPAAPEHMHEHRQPPEAAADFELVNQAGMHARPAAKIAGGLSGLDAEVTVNGADGSSMTELMMLGAGRGTVLHVEASGPDAAKAVDYLGGLITSGFGEP
ncbi:dihydroxyacetone kinase phosphoryl donor subunit DhaM [Pseudarthrobacter sp. MM222]|uniref:dihydroxyacetone kinase phosphoryl donor subunit DhaM n=1 Tax=Pseudarthrobacter sp. MM222 TaxID=3018929 RepID=UPI00221F0979|nr:dihydroxyacetone kinase phosphoryl donor subunit DhaM [Pseudarthrobacter sp. MM222]CAI3791013.1 PEP-dependent dihydroxyacetone kinase, phosphoryl donor subunit DhaM [Pseudarthrobacter sp. MM222]